MPSRKEEALAAISAANPKWSTKHVSYAYEMMPTSNEAYYEKGTSQRDQARAYWLHKWTLWAIEMNIVPDDTPIPPATPYPDGPSRRRSAPEPSPTTGASNPRAIATKDPSVTQQGIVAPRVGTVGRKIWDICDEVTTQHGREAKVEEILEVARTRGLNEGNAKTEFSRWRKFNVK